MNRILGLTIGSIFFTALAGAGSPLQRVPADLRARVNPLANDREASRAGAKLYAHECATCHGKNREGRAHMPPLNHSGVRSASPQALFWVLRNGSLWTGMPSFAHLPEPQRWQIVAFLQEPEASMATAPK